jgi:hypothetical protein
MLPNPFFRHNTLEKGCPRIWATSVFFIKQPKENNHPMVEKSPNLVTLVDDDRS